MAGHLELSFGLICAFRHACLRAGGNLVVWRSIVVLSMLLEVLVIVIAAVWMIVSMLRWSKLVQLLGACSKLILVAISSHWH